MALYNIQCLVFDFVHVNFFFFLRFHGLVVHITISFLFSTEYYIIKELFTQLSVDRYLVCSSLGFI